MRMPANLHDSIACDNQVICVLDAECQTFWFCVQIYGPDASPEMILSGQISPPPEFEILYSLINKLAASAVDELEDPLISS